MWSARIKELVAMMMIGEGVLATLSPQRHLELWHRVMPWHRGDSAWERMMTALLRHPDLMRVLGVAEAAAGIWLAQRQWDRALGAEASWAAPRLHRASAPEATRECR